MSVSSSVTSSKSNIKLVEALKSTNWRQPVKLPYDEADDLRTNKKHEHRQSFSDFDPDDPSTHQHNPVHGASPVRAASSNGFTTDPFFDTHGDYLDRTYDTYRRKVGILSGIAVAANAIAVPAKRAASAFLDIRRSSQKLHGASTFVFDIVVQHDACYDETTCRTHNGDFPMAKIENIKNSSRFHSPSATVKRGISEDGDNMHQPGSRTRKVSDGPRKQRCILQDEANHVNAAILTDSAVVNVEGFPTQKSGKTDAGSKVDQYNELIAKLNKAFNEKHIQETLSIRPPKHAFDTARVPSHRRRDKSDDSGVAFNPLQEAKQPSTSLDPTAKEFVVRAAPQGPAVIIKGKTMGGELTPESKAAAKEKAFIDAISCLAEYTKECKSLQELLQNSMPQHGNLQLGMEENSTTMMGSFAPGFLPMACVTGYPVPPCTPANGPILPPLGPQGMMMPHPGLMGPPLGMPGILGPMLPSFGPVPPPDHLGPGSMLSSAFMGPMMPHPPPPGHRGHLPMPPPGYGPGPGFGLGPFGPGFNFDSLLPPHQQQQQQMASAPLMPTLFARPVAKPKDPDTQSQMEYEAHIEWRKANEPGYALKCKERQHRRAIRINEGRPGRAIPIVAPSAETKV
ncbi:hypothetical protein ACHAQH_000400 [Verticillium albo-atrum]